MKSLSTFCEGSLPHSGEGDVRWDRFVPHLLFGTSSMWQFIESCVFGGDGNILMLAVGSMFAFPLTSVVKNSF